MIWQPTQRRHLTSKRPSRVFRDQCRLFPLCQQHVKELVNNFNYFQQHSTQTIIILLICLRFCFVYGFVCLEIYQTTKVLHSSN